MNFFLAFYRRLLKEKFYVLVCVVSMAMGIASAILIFMYLFSELTFDRYHQNHERIYRVTTSIGGVEMGQTGYEVGPLLVQENPQFLDYVRFQQAFETSFTYEDSVAQWADVYIVDESIFDIFTLIPVLGEKNSVFQDPYSIAISESFANYYFGDLDPIGQIIHTNTLDLRVTLIFEDLPENVTHRFDALMPFDLVEVYRPDYLASFGDRFFASLEATYLFVPHEFDPGHIDAATEYLFETNMAGEYQQLTGGAGPFALHLQNLSEIHFGNQLLQDESVGNMMNLYIFAVVAFSILIISSINYVNLATARASLRRKEMTIKKLLGANNQNLFYSLLAESIILIGIAFLVGMFLSIVVVKLGYIENFTGKAELVELIMTPSRMLLVIIFGLMLGILSGIYPAYSLSRQSILKFLRPSQKRQSLVMPIRHLLVMLQIAISMTLIACVLVMLRQVNFLNDAPLGFKKHDQFVVELRSADAIRSREAVITELNRHSEILSVVEMAGSIGRNLGVAILPIESDDGQTRTVTTNFFSVGEQFLETMEIELLLGNMFRNEQVVNEVGPVLVNEALVNHMGWTDPLGKVLGRSVVVGVMQDFNYEPMHEPIAPAFIRPFDDTYLDRLQGNQLEDASIDLVISTTGNSTTDTMAYIQQIVTRFSSQSIVEIDLLADIWNEKYDEEENVMELVGVFGGISIVISLLGLAGMSTYNAQQNSKEIAIRKVLGASVVDILLLYSKTLIKVIAISVFPALLVAYLASNIWLEEFAYRADLSITPYILSSASVSLFCIIVLISYTYRSAQANPIVKLKYE